VRRIERQGTATADRPRLALGAPALDARLPGGGLPLGALHEIEGLRGDWDDGAVTGFCLAILARLFEVRDGPVLWVSSLGDLYGPGLAAQGLDSERFFFARASNEAERLWALEEGLREPSLAAVVGEVETLSDRAGRRLQLAAEKSGVSVFILKRGLVPAARRRHTGAAATRWRVTAAPSRDDGRLDRRAPGAAAWSVELVRCRGAAPGAWRLSWGDEAGWSASDDETSNRTPHPFGLAAEFCHSEVVPRPAAKREHPPAAKAGAEVLRLSA
jgi:protein ImuA